MELLGNLKQSQCCNSFKISFQDMLEITKMTKADRIIFVSEAAFAIQL